MVNVINMLKAFLRFSLYDFILQTLFRESWRIILSKNHFSRWIGGMNSLHIEPLRIYSHEGSCVIVASLLERWVELARFGLWEGGEGQDTLEQCLFYFLMHTLYIQHFLPKIISIRLNTIEYKLAYPRLLTMFSMYLIFFYTTLFWCLINCSYRNIMSNLVRG